MLLLFWVACLVDKSTQYAMLMLLISGTSRGGRHEKAP